MAKINILFSGADYAIDEANLAPATDALKAHLETLGGGEGGGSLDYGTTVTFKEYISVEDLIAFTQSLGLSNPTDLYTVMAADPNVGLIQLLGITISSNGLYLQLHYQLLQPKEDGTGSTVIEHLVYEINEDSSHYAWENGLMGEILDQPPTITIFSPHSASQYEISQFEPLFDLSSIAGNEGDLDITLDGAVYKVDSTKLAPATNSLIAHIETLKGGEEGGGLVEGETYTLKNNLNAINPADFMKTPLVEGAYTIFRYDPSVSAGLGFVTAELLASFGANVASDGWMVTTPDIESIYYYPLKMVDYASGEMVDNYVGWLTIPGNNVAPEISITIPSPFNADYAGYSLDELAVFFDVSGAGGSNEVTETVTADSEFSHDLSAALGDAFGLHDAYRIDCPIGDIDTTSLVVQGKVHCDKPYKITFRSVNGEETSLYLNDDGNNEIGLALYFYTVLLLKAENYDKVFAVVVPDNLKELLIAAGVPEDQIDAGLALLGDSIPPNTILIPKTLFEGEEAFASVSVTYMTGGSGNEGDTKIVINGAEYWVDSAKLADAKNALGTALANLQSGGTN